MNTTEIKAWGLLLGGALLVLVIVALVHVAPSIVSAISSFSVHLSAYKDVIYNVAVLVITVLWLKGQIKEYLLVKELKMHRRHA